MHQRPFPASADRHAPWVFARGLVGANEWYASLWDRRERLRDIPARLLWGERDPGFGRDALARWQGVFDPVETTTFPDAGHLPQEETPEAVQAALGAFLRAAEPAHRAAE